MRVSWGSEARNAPGIFRSGTASVAGTVSGFDSKRKPTTSMGTWAGSSTYLRRVPVTVGQGEPARLARADRAEEPREVADGIGGRTGTGVDTGHHVAEVHDGRRRERHRPAVLGTQRGDDGGRVGQRSSRRVDSCDGGHQPAGYLRERRLSDVVALGLSRLLGRRFRQRPSWRRTREDGAEQTAARRQRERQAEHDPKAVGGTTHATLWPRHRWNAATWHRISCPALPAGGRMSAAGSRLRDVQTLREEAQDLVETRPGSACPRGRRDAR